MKVILERGRRDEKDNSVSIIFGRCVAVAFGLFHFRPDDKGEWTCERFREVLGSGELCIACGAVHKSGRNKHGNQIVLSDHRCLFKQI